MNTPICDFVKNYIEKSPLRLHMPGHKGKVYLGCEMWDITEISGADSLYEACGIIKQSEDNASLLFGCDTFYSTEGSSQCIRAMLYLAYKYAKRMNKAPLIFACRNVHKTFVNAIGMLGMDVEWLYSEGDESYLSCGINAQYLDDLLKNAHTLPVAVYITSPDYLGKMCDIKAMSEVCKKYDVLLIVDNAHGAYLKFINESCHPIDLGADMCCDSAHKTLPVLTGGAYLHIGNSVSDILSPIAKESLSLFGSTSPSYIILQSLDMANKYISEGYKDKLNRFVIKINKLKNELQSIGYVLYGDEPMKITIIPKNYGYDGIEFADILSDNDMACEFADRDFVTLMLTPDIDDCDIERIFEVLSSVEPKCEIKTLPPEIPHSERVMSIRDAVMSDSEAVDVDNSLGRILASPSVGCPPAVPVLMCGERITKEHIVAFKYYGVKELFVVKE